MSENKKKILVVSHYYPPHLGGIEIVAYNQAKYLAREGNSVTVVTSLVSKKEKAISYEDDVLVLRVKAWNFFEKFSVPFPVFLPQVFTVMRREVKCADVVHVHDAFYISSFVACLWGWWYKKPIVLTQHIAMIAHPSRLVVFIQKMVYKTSGKLVFMWSGYILTLNDRVENFLIKLGIEKKKIFSLPNGVDTTLFHPANNEEKSLLKKEFSIPSDKKIILFVGRFVPKKGFDKVLEARSDDYHIVFAGGDTPSEHFDNVTFLGKLDQTTLARVYRVADIFVLPSRDEGFPLSVQEAMATGLPIITSNDEGYERYLLDRDLVCLLDSPTSDLVRKTIKELIANTERMNKMSVYSRDYALTHFSWPTIVQKLSMLYDELIYRK